MTDIRLRSACASATGASTGSATETATGSATGAAIGSGSRTMHALPLLSCTDSLIPNSSLLIPNSATGASTGSATETATGSGAGSATGSGFSTPNSSLLAPLVISGCTRDNSSELCSPLVCTEIPNLLSNSIIDSRTASFASVISTCFLIEFKSFFISCINEFLSIKIV